MECCYCKKDFPAVEVRPYGPDSAFTCYPCAMATPEREDLAKKQFHSVVDAINGPVAITDEGVKSLHSAIHGD